MWMKLLIAVLMFPACSGKQPPPPSPVVAVPAAPAADLGHATDATTAHADADAARGDLVSEPAALAPNTVAAGCESSCFEDGQCTLAADGKSCVASSHADCAASRLCETQGHCIAENGRCVASCWRTEWVARHRAEGGGSCVRDPHTPCHATPACDVGGFCVDDGDTRCEWGPDCKASCKAEGACVISMGRCVVASDDDCKQSVACERENRCALAADGACVTRENADAACSPGRVSVDGSCHFPTGYACEAECKAYNRCEPFVSHTRRDGKKSSRPFVECVESEAYCAKQPDCAERGICGAVKERLYEYNKCGYFSEPCGEPLWGGCKKTAKGCKRSKRCKLDGSCSNESFSRFCRPTVAEHCEQSVDCKRLGNCGLIRVSGYHECGATEQAHCEQSDDCKRNGACALVRGDCVRSN